MSDLASFANMLEVLKDPKEMERRFGELARKQQELEKLQKEIAVDRAAAEAASAAAKQQREYSARDLKDAKEARAEATRKLDRASEIDSGLAAKQEANSIANEKISRQYADIAAKQKALDEKDATLTALSNELNLRKKALDAWVGRIRQVLES